MLLCCRFHVVKTSICFGVQGGTTFRAYEMHQTELQCHGLSLFDQDFGRVTTFQPPGDLRYFAHIQNRFAYGDLKATTPSSATGAL